MKLHATSEMGGDLIHSTHTSLLHSPKMELSILVGTTPFLYLSGLCGNVRWIGLNLCSQTDAYMCKSSTR